jgi:hypothetical protein
MTDDNATTIPATAAGPARGIFFCTKGHSLASRFSFRRGSTGARYCLRCESDRALGQVARGRRTRADQTRRNARKRERLYREATQASAIAASVRATTPTTEGNEA